jgi:hypothetical protein
MTGRPATATAHAALGPWTCLGPVMTRRSVYVKRVVMTAAAVGVLALAGCGGGDSDSGASASPSQTAAASASETAAAPSVDVAAVNKQVRTACQDAVTEKLAGAEFPTSGSLRAASSEGGKLYTVSGTAQAGGKAHPYSCDLTVQGDEVTVDGVTVDGT